MSMYVNAFRSTGPLSQNSLDQNNRTHMIGRGSEWISSNIMYNDDTVVIVGTNSQFAIPFPMVDPEVCEQSK